MDIQLRYRFKTTNYFYLALFSLILNISANETNAQLSYKVLFLGNSYTGVNNLPQIIHDVALSVGDTLIFDSYSPGGYRLIDHSLDVNSQNKISTGDWDYVVIQGQSQEPIMGNTEFLSGAGALFNLIKQENQCTVVMPYMTWGRKNGDAANCPDYPQMCTYQSMDTTLRDAYFGVARSINGEISPVSIVWNYIRQNFPNIELYQADESHPSVAGSYAAACCFYTVLFKKDPALITFDFGLSANDASIIRSAVKSEVFDSLQLWDFKKLPASAFHYQIGSGVNEVTLGASGHTTFQTYSWNFGDGDTSSSSHVTHSYLADGTYTVSLTTTNCDLNGSYTSFTDTVIQFCSHTPTIYTTHPWLCNNDTLWTEAADSYQWFDGVPLPETNQFLANYSQYNISGFSVISTVNGCSELSQLYNDTPEWSGYYFDAIGEPCFGDTVSFSVLHINGFLSGVENILWFKNDTLIQTMTNEDTLFIISEGKYECKIIDPNSDCPLDTTSYFIEYNCGIAGVHEQTRELFWDIFPNPASETITIKFIKNPLAKTIEIYNLTGSLMRSIVLKTASNKIDISDLSNGLYFIRLKNSGQLPFKFMKM